MNDDVSSKRGSSNIAVGGVVVALALMVATGIVFYNELRQFMCNWGLLCPANPDPRHVSSACVEPANANPRVGGMAYWVHNSFEAFNGGDYAGAIASVNACLSNWQQKANQDQEDLDAQHEADARQAPEPPFGVVDQATMRRVLGTNPEIHAVGTSLWILGRSHHLLNHEDDARHAYEQCKRLTRARNWDPAGWLWQPATDCRTHLSSL